MALRGGESVGSAYVRIYATGDGVPDDIRRILREAEPSIRDEAENHGDLYEERFSAQAAKNFKTRFNKTPNEMFQGLDESFKREVERIDFADNFFKTRKWQEFKARVQSEFPDTMRTAVQLALRDMENEFRTSGDLDRIESDMDRFGIRVRNAQARILRGFDADAQRMLALFKKNVSEVTSQVERLEGGDRTVHRTRLMQFVDTLHDMAPDLINDKHQLADFLFHLDNLERRLITSTPRISRWRRGWDDVAYSMGKVFGLGSRNNFLNFFGVVVRGMTSLTGHAVLGPLQFFARQWNAVRDVFQEGGGGLTGSVDAFLSVMKSLGGVLGSVVAGLVGFAALLAVIGLLLGPIVGLLSSLLGILTAMASSAIMGAIGAVAGFGPLLLGAGGVVAGVVALVAAFKDVNNEAPAVKKNLKALQDTASGLWNTFKDRALANLPSVLEQANHALTGTEPLVKAAGDGFRRFLDEIANAVDSPAIQAFVDRFARFLPHTMDRFGQVVGNVFRGLAGVLRASIPLANDLSGWLVDITDKFAKWANSAKGQKEIKDFLDRAGDSAKAIGDFLEGAWHWLTQLISKSKGTGDSLWISLGGKFEEWAQWIVDHPDAFEQWMKDSAETAQNISDLVDGLTHLIDALDTSQNRQIGGDLLTGLGVTLGGLAFFWTTILPTIISGIRDLPDMLSGAIEALGPELGAVWYVVGGAWVGDLFHGIRDAAKAIGRFLADTLSGIWDSLRSMGPHGGGAMLIQLPTPDLGAIRRAFSKVGGWAAQAVRDLVSPFRGLAGRIASAAGNIASRVIALFSSLPGRVQTVVNQIVARWGNIAERIARTIGDVWRAISSHFTGLVTDVQGVASDIVGAFAGLGGRIASAIGGIHINWPSPPGWVSWALKHGLASGGIVSGGQMRLVGEAGPEAVVPLNRPLSMVDPSVRWLSAIAQGKVELPDSGGNNKLVSADGWTIVTPSQDPRIVATEVLNELVARVV